MKTQSIDTNPETEKFLIELFKNATITKRLMQAASLTSLTIKLSKRAIARANPDKTKNELDIIFVKLNYGEVLAEKLNKYYREQKNEN